MNLNVVDYDNIWRYRVVIVYICVRRYLFGLYIGIVIFILGMFDLEDVLKDSLWRK